MSDSLNRYIGRLALGAREPESSFPAFASVQTSEFTKRTHCSVRWRGEGGKRGDGEKGGFHCSAGIYETNPPRQKSRISGFEISDCPGTVVRIVPRGFLRNEPNVRTSAIRK
jgi:hypothetical protein